VDNVNIFRKSPTVFGQTVEVLTRGWFPVHSAVLAKVRQRLNAGIYQSERALLVDDLKSDCALYLFCLRELSLLTRSKNGVRRNVSASSFATMIMEASEDHLRLVFSNGPETISAHKLENASVFQAERFEECLVSAATAELLGPAFGLDARESFNCALLRQLGLMLICWNYPKVYAQALSLMRESYSAGGADLDTVLQALLGFSPSLLGAKTAQSWGLSEQAIRPLQMHRGYDIDPDKFTREQDKSELLAKISSVGEALARAGNPELYPEAQAHWEGAERVVRKKLGPDGVRLIFQQAEKLGEQYCALSPVLFRMSERSVASAHAFPSEYSKQCYNKNIHLRRCPPAARQQLERIYETLKDSVDDILVRTFFFDVVPKVGFDCSAVFMLDAGRPALVPTFHSGTPKFVKLKPLSLLEGESETHPFREALHRSTPLEGEGIAGGTSRKYFVGSLGSERGIGVVHLELSPGASSEISDNAAVIFQALRQCLHDLVHLN